MKYLIAGTVSAERLELLISLTSIRSEDMKEALKWHLVHGHQQATAAALAQVPPNNLGRAMTVVERVASIVEAIKEYDRFSRFTGDAVDDVVVTHDDDDDDDDE